MGKDKKLYAAFMDLEKAYDRVNREALCSVLQIYDVGGQLLKGIQDFYRDGVHPRIIKEAATELLVSINQSSIAPTPRSLRKRPPRGWPRQADLHLSLSMHSLLAHFKPFPLTPFSLTFSFALSSHLPRGLPLLVVPLALLKYTFPNPSSIHPFLLCLSVLLLLFFCKLKEKGEVCGHRIQRSSTQ